MTKRSRSTVGSELLPGSVLSPSAALVGLNSSLFCFARSCMIAHVTSRNVSNELGTGMNTHKPGGAQRASQPCGSSHQQPEHRCARHCPPRRAHAAAAADRRGAGNGRLLLLFKVGVRHTDQRFHACGAESRRGPQQAGVSMCLVQHALRAKIAFRPGRVERGWAGAKGTQHRCMQQCWCGPAQGMPPSRSRRIAAGGSRAGQLLPTNPCPIACHCTLPTIGAVAVCLGCDPVVARCGGQLPRELANLRPAGPQRRQRWGNRWLARGSNGSLGSEWDADACLAARRALLWWRQLATRTGTEGSLPEGLCEQNSCTCATVGAHPARGRQLPVLFRGKAGEAGGAGVGGNLEHAVVLCKMETEGNNTWAGDKAIVENCMHVGAVPYIYLNSP